MNLGRFSLAALREKVSSLPPLKRVLLFVGTFLLLGGAFYFWQYQPQAEYIARLETDLAEKQKRLAALKRAAAELPALQEAFAKAQADFDQLLSQLPDRKEIPALLETISQLGAQVGLENILFQPQPEQIFEFYAVIPIRLDLLGTYHKLGVFFDSMSKLNRILKVENLAITRPRGGSQLQVGCTIVTYRFIEKPSEGQGAAKSK